MKCLAPVTLALMFSAVFLTGAAKAVDFPILDLAVEDVLRLPSTRGIVYSPVRLNPGDSLSFTALQLTEVSARSANVFRGTQINVFAIVPSLGGGYTGKAYNFVVPVSTGPSGAPDRSSGYPAGKVSILDLPYSAFSDELRFADGSLRLLIVAAGIEAADLDATPKPAPLPKEHSLTVQLDQQGTSLLLPAVQKVRDIPR